MRVFALIFIAHAAAFYNNDIFDHSVKLSDGVDMPKLSFGANVWDAPVCKSATTAALQAGFRFIWSSTLIGADCQSAQLEAIQASQIKRNELFVAGTVNTQSCSGSDDCYTSTKTDAEGQFKLLGGDLDMLMLDYPSSGCDSIRGQWKAFEELHAAKKVRTIAVSNFNAKDLQCITANRSGAVLPTVNQLSYSVGHGQDTAVQDNAKLGIVVQAYSPLGSGSLASDPLLKKIGDNHNKSAAQVALRWILQRNATITTESTQLNYLQEDADIFSFNLSPQEMDQLDAHSEGAVAQGANWAVRDTCSLFQISDSTCGQSDLECKYAPYAKKFEKGLQDGTCSSQGYTVPAGSQTMKVPVVGGMTISKYTKKATEAVTTAPCSGFKEGVFADMHDGDQKKVTLVGTNLTITPHANNQTWTVNSRIDTECRAVIDFHVPGKPAYPPVNLLASFYKMERTSENKMGIEFTDPSGTIAKPAFPLNYWIQI